MTTSFFFYDLETSGVNPRTARVMQFAGQRTDMDLNPIGEPVNLLIKLSDDIVPEPDAIMITGITPQQTVLEGHTEAEFLQIFHEIVATPGTIFVGFNTVRFDDEFIRYMHYRNFYDPYEWQYTEGKSRWDLLDLVRMTRALRPDGIAWPVDSEGKPTNRLELLTKENGLSHESAHDALSDVQATIAVASLIKDKQPKLFEYLLRLRDKKAVDALVSENQPFLYSSGKYASEFEKTAAVSVLARHPKRAGALVYDLRHDPDIFKDITVDELVDIWRYNPDRGAVRLPVKTLQFNRCPAVAPLGVLNKAAQERLQLSPETISKHNNKLQSSGLADKVISALDILDNEQEKARTPSDDVDEQLYESFLNNDDKTPMRSIRSADKTTIAELNPRFIDKRLKALMPRYKARNFPTKLSESERAQWDEYRKHKFLHGGNTSLLAKYFARLAELSQQADLSPQRQYLLEELQLYGQSITPITED